MKYNSDVNNVQMYSGQTTEIRRLRKTLYNSCTLYTRICFATKNGQLVYEIHNYAGQSADPNDLFSAFIARCLALTSQTYLLTYLLLYLADSIMVNVTPQRHLQKDKLFYYNAPSLKYRLG